VGEERLLQPRLQRRRYDAAATLFAKGKGAMWIGGDWDSTIIKALGTQNWA
jgi:ABC-type glycerol-3-phosphate transport system substrate-binding protein